MNHIASRLRAIDIVNRGERNLTPQEFEERQRVEDAIAQYRRADYRRDEVRDGLYRLIFWTVVILAFTTGAVLWILHHP